ncbi:MAG: tRNA pseudouridine(13) synthase TruD [Nanoarchaeota archaeon]|nr:tRNA pseudouridine(13) synthase TruD [Nanoarchaeota archaeon]
MKEIEKVPAKIKHKPEDFIVEEIGDKWICTVEPTTNHRPPTTENSNAVFLWCELEKKNIDHFRAIEEISTALQTREIGYAGSKDKRAWTSQRISIFKPNIELVKNFSHPDIILKNFKWNKRKIKIGYLDGNHFKITLRDIDKKDAMTITKQIRNLEWFPNYFGSQRFGINQGNVKIGKLLLKRKWAEALKEINGQESNDPLSSLKKINRKNMLMYINSVQSKIFNDILEQALEENIKFKLTTNSQRLTANKQEPSSCLLMGYNTRFFSGRLGEIEQQILTAHNLTLENFNIKELPFLRMKGSFRKAVTEIKDLEIETSDDDEFPGSKKIYLAFTLPSGTYATTFLENFFILN